MLFCCQKLIKWHNNVYIYGAGSIAAEVAYLMNEHGMKFDGFVVTRYEDKKVTYCSKPVFTVYELFERPDRDFGVILGLNKDYVFEVQPFLKGVDYVNVGRYSLKYSGNRKYQER